ncbi:MAG: NAD(P)-binding domain-containing protein [Amylibacter sp.]|nr:NAD(P)-binding domain-containing protein [Amylibacter sp.]
MTIEKTQTLIVGAGQAGLAMSEHLTKAGVSHLVLERDRIAERWRSQRWDALVANGPAWHDCFPSMKFKGFDPEAFIPKEDIADYLVAYAKMNNSPIRTGVEVTDVQRLEGGAGFRVKTSDGVIEAGSIVAATGPFQNPVIPPVIPETAPVKQMHSSEYRNPDQLPKGAVLVVGAGSSGAQIADELLRAGRRVYLSTGPHDRPPRSYRKRDFVWWLGVLGMWDDAALEVGREHVTIAVSGARGGNTVNFRQLAQNGMILVGRTETYDNGVLTFAQDLVKNLAGGDANYLSLLDAADAYIQRNGLDLPEEPTARDTVADAACITDPILQLDMEEAGIKSVIWATGFSADYSWLKVDAFDETGKPDHQRGVSSEPGVYFLGLPWLSRRGSPFIWGVWHDAKFLTDHITTQQKYEAYKHPE